MAWDFIFQRLFLGFESLYLLESQYVSCQKIGSKSPKHDFIAYCQDLNALYSDYSIEDDQFQKGGVAFSELVDELFKDKRVLGSFQKIDLCIFLHWTYEFDPDYTHVGPYIAEEYNIHCNMLDIMEQCSLSFVSAWTILDAYFNDNGIQSAAIISFEQATQPISRPDSIAFPKAHGIEFALISSIYTP